MMKTRDFSYFIERYNSFEMTEAERQWFLKEMDNNEQLKREVGLRRQTDEILKKSDVISLRLKLSQIEKNRQERLRARTSRRSSVIRFAAVFAGAAVITSLLLFSGRTLTSEEIIDRYYLSYEAPSAQRSMAYEANTDYILGLRYYNAHDYKNAALQFSKVLEINPDDMQTHMLSGVSNMEDKRYSEAEKSFTTVVDDNNNLFIESASWYLALCYVKTEERDKAHEMLVSIRNEGGFYSRDAKKVIRRLK